MKKQQKQWVTALIVLPLYYNPDEQNRRLRIERNKFAVTGKEITYQFGGGLVRLVPAEEGKTKGLWFEKGIIWEDDIAVLEADMFDTEENRSWLKEYARDILLKRFEQEAIYIKFVRIVEVELIQVSNDT